ncbi:MAG: outer membrane beta-barrel protein [Bacteroidales bacterium]
MNGTGLLFKVMATIIVLIAITGNGYSQDCALKLQDAQTQFDRGKVELVAGLITPCIKSGGFSREESLSAYKLLIQSLLLDDNNTLAEEYMLEFLSRHPEYSVTAADYTGFVYLRNKYEVRQSCLISVRFGTNFTYLTGHNERSISSLTPDISYSREPLSIFAGAEIAMPLNSILSLSAGIGYSSVAFRYSENMMNFGTVTYRENQARLEIPLSAIWNIADYRSVKLYARGGAGYAMNLHTDSKASFITTDINNGFNRTGENLNRSSSRIKNDLFLHAGVGGMIKIPRGYITAEIRTLCGLRNQVVRSEPGNLEYFYFYTDDSFRVNTAGFTISYTYVFYKPIRISGS